ncbi:alpha/beta hydrolase [Streptacidiphilus albus]|uniref:alpha/beta hydrolase n=1 Tax=Streptacidiphilus albus TaxID=105425 RepID=UPI00069107CC|nr:alpha/beta fold hydrolase [Streptacidiphilus albus]
MSLTGTPFFAITILIVVLAVTGMIAVWNRIPGPHAVRIIGRVGMTVLSQAAAVLMVLVYVNNSMGPFYDSWGDLFGSNATVQMSATGNQTGKPIGGTKPGTVQADPLTFSTYTTGVLKTKAVGPESHIKGSLYVWLPPQYNQAQFAHTEFPVVELLPGTPGTPQTWFGTMKANDEMVKLMGEGKVKPMILVAATLNMFGGGNDSGCANLPGSYQTATWLAKDVPTMIKGNFRAATDAKHWAIMGYSAGGYCSANLTVQYPQSFHAAVTMSGYNYPDAAVVLKDPALAKANNPYLLLKDAKQQPDIVILAAGSLGDPGTMPDARALIGVLHNPGPSRVMQLDHGSHTTAVFQTMLPDSLVWISQQIAV